MVAGWNERTDAVALEEHLLQLTDVLVLQALQDVDLARKVVALVLIAGLDTVLARMAQAPPELVRLDHLDGVPVALGLVQRLHDRRERAFAELVLEVVDRVEAALRGVEA